MLDFSELEVYCVSEAMYTQIHTSCLRWFSQG